MKLIINSLIIHRVTVSDLVYNNDMSHWFFIIFIIVNLWTTISRKLLNWLIWKWLLNSQINAHNYYEKLSALISGHVTPPWYFPIGRWDENRNFYSGRKHYFLLFITAKSYLWIRQLSRYSTVKRRETPCILHNRFLSCIVPKSQLF